MAMEQDLRETVPQNNINKADETSLDKLKSFSEAVDESANRLSGDFECNICLDAVRDPMVTLCGHLYCWPCIYKWIRQQTTTSEIRHGLRPQCPVCKSEISKKTLVPLYVPGVTTKPTSGEKTSDLSIGMPHRPPAPRWRVETMPSSQLSYRGFQQQRSPATGMFGDVVYERLFGNSQTSLLAYPNSYSLAGISTRRARRQAVHVERSLSRICFFLLCCIILCLFLF